MRPQRRAVCPWVLVLAFAMAGCDEHSDCYALLNWMLEDGSTVGDDGLIELVITFENETAEDVIEVAIERSGGVVLAQYPVNYVTLGFESEDVALRAADYLGDHEAVAACMPHAGSPGPSPGVRSAAARRSGP